MAQELSLVGAGDKLALPAHLQARFAGTQSNIITDSRGSSLGIRGKAFTVTVSGESQKLMRADPESGDQIPVAVLPVVVLDYGVKMGRSYYDSAFDPDVQAQPTCWSLDGVVPEPEVAEKQSLRCATCPMAAKGSKVTDNNKSVMACATHRILVVAPLRGLDTLPPLQLRIAQTSDYDGQNPEAKAKGYFAFKQYLEALKNRGIPSTRAVVTNLSFDVNAAYPKLFFRAQRFVEPAEDAKVQAIMDGGKVREILTWTGTEAQIAGENQRPEPGEEVVQQAANRSSSAQDGRFAAAEASLGEKAAAKPKVEKATTQAAAKAAPKGDGVDFSKLSKPAAAASEFVAPERQDDEDDEDYDLRVSAARRKHVKAQAALLAAKAPTFVAPPREDGEDDEDYDLRVQMAKRKFDKAAAAAAPAAAPKPQFVAPERQDDEDDEDYELRVTAARRKFEKANGGAPAAAPVKAKPKTVEAEPVPVGEEKPASKFPGGAMDLGADDDGAAPAAPAKKTRGKAAPKGEAKAPVEAATAQAVPKDVEDILNQWED